MTRVLCDHCEQPMPDAPDTFQTNSLSYESTYTHKYRDGVLNGHRFRVIASVQLNGRLRPAELCESCTAMFILHRYGKG